MKEDLIQFVWRFGYFNKKEIHTTNQLPIQIIHPGQLNTDAGPDFLNGQVKIGNQIWHGHIEIHTQSSEWNKHGHSGDPQYDNVILHVVHNHDKDILYKQGQPIPTLELKHRIPTHIFKNYDQLKSQLNWIPCSGILPHYFSELKWASWSERLIIERIENKIEKLKIVFIKNNNNWEETLYTWLAYGFGLKVNSDTFMALAERIHPKFISQYRDQPGLVKALFYGAADMLSDKHQDKLPNRLYKEWHFLKQKHNLNFSSNLLWKYHRMRPTSFPALRISQFIQLHIDEASIASRIIDAENIKAIQSIFKLKAGDYWANHTKFDQEVKPQSTNTGDGFIRQLIINVIVPYIFFYGQETGRQDLKDKAIQWLHQLKAEDNIIIRKWKEEGIVAQHASDSQALYHLKKEYCDEKLCLHCSFGHAILKKEI